MRYLIVIIFRYLIQQSQRTYDSPQEVLNIPIDPISTVMTLERYTVRHRCAIDSGMRIKSSDRDYDTFTDDGDWSLYAEFLKFERVNSAAIRKEENDRYKY